MSDQDWLDYQEGLASHHLEYEAWQAEQRHDVDLRIGGDGWKLTRDKAGGYLIEITGWMDERQVLTLANTLLSEIELGQRDPWVDDPVYSWYDWLQDVAQGNTRRGYKHWVEAQREANDDCSLCHGARVIAVAGPDENGQYDTDDCPACSQPIVCECELDWNCPLHQGGPTAIERINHDWASEQTEIDRQNGM